MSVFGASNNGGVAPALLRGSERIGLAIQALARWETLSALAARLGVSRQFVYQQRHKAVVALVGTFFSVTPDNEVLLELEFAPFWRVELA